VALGVVRMAELHRNLSRDQEASNGWTRPQPVAWDLDHPRYGDWGPQRRAVRPGKEPASIIAAQLRHADGGALAQRVYIHQLPQTAPRVAGVIEGMFGPAAHAGRAVSAGRRVEGNRSETGASNPA
jgi:hypothetical protein